MSYLVIARKWRPALFEDIVGQAHVTRTLRNAITSGRIAHAFLFSGPRGVGKTTAARILAKGLNCAKGPTPTPCNSCESCRAIVGGSSVDVFEIDGASNNSVDNIRELTESVRYVPGQGKYRVYIIDEVHMLSIAAFNALLKTLEEPPPHAIFIFATTEIHKVPLTILSRCQRFDFKRIPFREIQQRLLKIVTEEGVPFEEKALFTIAREADGSLRDAQSLLEQALSYCAGELKDAGVSEALGLIDRSLIYDLSEALIAKDGRACLNIVEKMHDFGYDLKRGLSDLLAHIRDLTVVKVTGDFTLLDLPDSELERLKSLSERTGAPRLQMLFSIVSKGYEEAVRSPSPRFSFEMALLKAAHFGEVEPIGELVSRLEALKGGFETPGLKAIPAQPLKAVEPAKVKRPEEASPAQVKASEAVSPYTVNRAGAEGGEDLKAHIRQRISSLSEALQSVVIKVEGDEVGFTVSGDKQAIFRLKDKQIESACTEYFGRRVCISINAVDTIRTDNNKKKEAGPLVKDAVRILGGKVIEDRRRSNV